ncbi:MAG: flavin reductase family protein [Clostridiales bacterium]|nr:flavin reductase family protein [Clostridiales bacterium]
MKKLAYQETANAVLDAMLKGGVFLTAGNMEDANTMTIGWGAVEVMWGKGVFLAVVRPQRHTYSLLNKYDTFTVSVPTADPLKKELAICGSKSGRDLDKWEAAGLTKAPGQEVDTPIVKECGLHFECRILAKQTFEPVLMDGEVKDRWYAAHDYHTKFYGEIIACYSTDE